MSAQGPAESTPVGLVRSAVALGAAALVTRGELAALELTEARAAAGRWLALALVGAVLLLAALVLGALFPVALFWDTHRLTAIAVVAIVYVLVGGGLLVWLLARLRHAPPLLQATLAELRQDVVALRGHVR